MTSQHISDFDKNSPIILGIGGDGQARVANKVEARQDAAASSPTQTTAANVVQGGGGAQGETCECDRGAAASERLFGPGHPRQREKRR